MALQKQNINLNFSLGLDTKTDPFQVQAGKFLNLENSIFTKGGLLQKRNGYTALPSLPTNNSTLVTTFKNDLTAIGNTFQAFSPGSGSWINKGSIQTVGLSVQSLIRNNTNQSQADNVVASNGLMCTVYTDQNPASLGASIYKIVVSDYATGQNILSPTVIATADATFGTPRVFLLGSHFIVLFTSFSAGSYHLNYVSISVVNPTVVSAPVSIDVYTPAATLAFDGIIFNNTLYLVYNGAASSGIKVRTLTNTLFLSGFSVLDGAHQATMFTMAVDTTNSIIYITYYNSGSSTGYTVAITGNIFNIILTPTQVIASGTFLNLASSATNGLMTLVMEKANNYSYDSSIPTHLLDTLTVTQSGTVSSTAVLARSVGLASKTFAINGNYYFLTAFQSPYQPTYFLMDIMGNVVAKLAYSNGGGYLTHGLPSVTLVGSVASIPYLFKDAITAVNKDTNVPAGTQVNGIYAQLGLNLASFDMGAEVLSVEMGNNLNLSGGFAWTYDGYLPVEQNFFVWPDSVEATTSTSGGFLADQQYFYQAVYEWTDNQGNIIRGAPSIPITITTAGGGTSSNTVNIPTLRLTYKVANPVKITLYRWSVAQQIYYEITSITAPILNNKTVDSVAVVDTLSDASILGNSILYTTGGVVENIGPPATNIMTLFDDRLWLLDAEDTNLLWYSKQVIEATPVEMSDLFTIYVAPSASIQESAGPITAIAAMDGRLIIFKSGSIAYISGSGPDNTGANSQYTQPIFITSTVGCTNQKSIVLTPSGIMFQSSKGIWLLSRNLSTEYIGAAVEKYNSSLVTSSVNVPSTNQVRFGLDNGITLMYDYFYSQWVIFKGISSVSSTNYQNLHTFIDSFGRVFQESPGLYVDGANPVLIGFTTAWFNLTGLQGYMRAYMFYLLGQYMSPHKINLQIAYDYNPSVFQSVNISPGNFGPAYGTDTPYGQGSPYGGPGDIEQWRVFLTQQRCESFQITLTEMFDPIFGTAPGAGLTLSGLNLVYGAKKGYRPQLASQSAGAS